MGQIHIYRGWQPSKPCVFIKLTARKKKELYIKKVRHRCQVRSNSDSKREKVKMKNPKVFIHPLTFSLNHLLLHSLTHPLIHSLPHSPFMLQEASYIMPFLN